MKIIIDGKAAEVSVSGGGLPEGTVAVKPLTKAEYDALTDEEKQADVAYAITDDAGSGGGSGGSSEEIYSAEETRIGTWIDGKPLYRNVLSFVVPYQDYTIATEYMVPDSTALISDPVETLVSVGGSYVDTNGCLCSLMSVRSSGSDRIHFISLASNKKQIMLEISKMNKNITLTMILEYTKTTDTGGAT